MENETRGKKGSEKKKKVILVFDPKARREYLTGFHKRKQERRKKAQEQLERMMKEEKKSIKRKTKEVYSNLIAPYQSGHHKPELLLKEEHDVGSHSVEITELSTFELAKENNWIGSNQVKYEEDDKESENEASDSEVVPGMEMEDKPIIKKKEKPGEEINITSIKDLKRTIRMQATRQIKKSKAFKTHGIKEKMKNKKKSKREKRDMERAMKKSKKNKLKGKSSKAKTDGES